jgi:hypothetical protein
MVAKRSSNELSEARGVGGTIIYQGQGPYLTIMNCTSFCNYAPLAGTPLHNKVQLLLPHVEGFNPPHARPCMQSGDGTVFCHISALPSSPTLQPLTSPHLSPLQHSRPTVPFHSLPPRWLGFTPAGRGFRVRKFPLVGRHSHLCSLPVHRAVASRPEVSSVSSPSPTPWSGHTHMGKRVSWVSIVLFRILTVF